MGPHSLNLAGAAREGNARENRSAAEAGREFVSLAPPQPRFWEWVAPYERLEDRLSRPFVPAANRLYGLALFVGIWCYRMPDFGALKKSLGAFIVVPIFLHYTLGVGGLSWGLWQLTRERFPWDR